jgi:hypothetical protein
MALRRKRLSLPRVYAVKTISDFSRYLAPNFLQYTNGNPDQGATLQDKLC